jgi:23S rRNA (adenine2030-N6)-methyltransferase
VLIDPSYEDKDDYRKVIDTVRDALQRFATGTYAVWYPQVQRRESLDLPEKLERIAGSDWLHAWLRVKAPAAGGLGLHGSGVFVINPPWKLDAALRPVMPVLVKLLGQDATAACGLHARQT